jgi:ribosomal protein S18 acetylase RimI-like enzyme
MIAVAALAIRAFERADADAVIGLWQRCGLTRPWNDPRRDIERKLQVQPELFLIGTLGAELAASAMAGYDGHRGAVYYLAVEPALHGRGYGRAMMDAVCARLLALGCPKLNLMVRGDNLGATAFYERLDFDKQDVVTYGLRLVPDTSP